MNESSRVTPAQTALAVVLQVRSGVLQALVWQRAMEPFAGAWSLPGGYLEPGETLEQSIRRHLAVKVDVRELSHLEQLETLSDPRNPRRWELATAYLGLVPSDLDPAVPEDTAWHAVATPSLHGVRPRGDRDRRARPAAREALVHKPRLRARAGDVHDLGAPRPLYRRARARRLPHEPQASAPTPRRPRADGHAALTGTGRRSPGELYRFRTPRLEITDQFAVLRPPPVT